MAMLASTFPKNSEKELQELILKIKEICEAFILPQEMVAENLKDIYKGLSDKSFWIALADIHSIADGKLTDWKNCESAKEDFDL